MFLLIWCLSLSKLRLTSSGYLVLPFMQKITSVHLYNIALSSFFVVLTDVIYSWSYGALYDSYSGLNLVWLSSPGSSEAWLLASLSAFYAHLSTCWQPHGVTVWGLMSGSDLLLIWCSHGFYFYWFSPLISDLWLIPVQLFRGITRLILWH